MVLKYQTISRMKVQTELVGHNITKLHNYRFTRSHRKVYIRCPSRNSVVDEHGNFDSKLCVQIHTSLSDSSKQTTHRRQILSISTHNGTTLQIMHFQVVCIPPSDAKSGKLKLNRISLMTTDHKIPSNTP